MTTAHTVVNKHIPLFAVFGVALSIAHDLGTENRSNPNAKDDGYENFDEHAYRVKQVNKNHPWVSIRTKRSEVF